MKKAILNTRSMCMILLAALTLGTSQLSLANEAVEKKSEFTFIGSMESSPVFQLRLNNTDEDDFLVTIKDKNREVLYIGRLKGTNISKKYRFDIDREDLQNIEVQITSKKSLQTQVYKINQEIRLVEDVWVAKL